MACYLCNDEGVAGVYGAGSCGWCGGTVCVEPSAGPRPHADFCGCDDCEKLICEKHLRKHTQGNHGCNPEHCFPALSARAAGPAFSSVLALRSGIHPKRTGSGPINRFLNTVTPGHEWLRYMATRIKSKVWSRSSETGEDEDWYVEFNLEFLLRRPMLSVVGFLAGYTLGFSLQRLAERDPVRQRHWERHIGFDDAHFLINDLVRWSEGLPSSVGLEIGGPIAGPPRTFEMQEGLFRSAVSSALSTTDDRLGVQSRSGG